MQLRCPHYSSEEQDQSILSLLSDNEDEAEDVFQIRQRQMSLIYKDKMKRQASILVPERLNEQEDYIEDLLEDDAFVTEAITDDNHLVNCEI